MTLRCSSVSSRTSSHCATFVSWNSSTRTWPKRCRHASSTSGCSRNRRTTSSSRSSKSAAEASAQAALVLDVDLGDPPLGRADAPVARLLRLGTSSFFSAEICVVQPPGGEPLRVQVEVAAHVVDEPDGVGLVVDRERGAVPEQRRLAAQDARARGVERRHPHAMRDRADERADPLLHLARGLVGERDREQLERRERCAPR